jgi:hypothetical protein
VIHPPKCWNASACASSKYQALPPTDARPADKLGDAACETVGRAQFAPTPAQKAALIAAYQTAVRGLANGG